MPAISLAQQLVRTNNQPTGFDYLRLILATAVIASHTVPTAYGKVVETHFLSGPIRPVVALILLMFFALSGFLVAGSLDRSRTIALFLGLRVIRIFPALGVEVILSALILGPIVTILPLPAYLS